MSFRLKIPEIKLCIYYYMTRKDFSIKYLAEHLNVSTRTVYNWMDCNSDKLPTVDNFILLSELLGFDIDKLFIKLFEEDEEK